MKKYEIVKEKYEFDDIIKNGKYKKNPFFIIYFKKNEKKIRRFGIAVGKKIGNAVTRNKFKRRIRMIINNNKNVFKNNYDYIIILKSKAVDLNYNQLNSSLIKLNEMIGD